MGQMKLSGKVAIVTGAGQNIGKAIAWRLAQEGSTVVVADINIEKAEQVANEINETGLQAVPQYVNVSVKEDVDRMVDKFAKVDILVNVAGILGPSCPFVEVKEADWDKTIEVNLKGTFLCCQAVIPGMVEQGYGRIVNISSVSAKEGNPELAPYVASKGAVIALTKSIGKELAKTGLTCNCVTPTMIEGEMVKSMTSEYFQSLLAKIPMGRLGKPEEVANVVNFLVSDEAAFITGQAYDLSGGRSVY